MARQTNDGEPTYGSDLGDKTKEVGTGLSQRFSGASAGQLSPAGDGPPLEQTRLAENGTEIAGVLRSPPEPD